MKTIITILSIIGMMSINAGQDVSVHDFEIKTIDGEYLNLESYKGSVILIVNTASECGYTSQYEALQSVYQAYEDEGLVILGFPANNFGGQEPGSEEEIMQFCQVNYGVTFPLSAKVSVRGDDIDPLFNFLTTQNNQSFTGDIKWNFEKFLVNKEGELVKRFRSKVKPDSKDIIASIETELNKKFE